MSPYFLDLFLDHNSLTNHMFCSHHHRTRPARLVESHLRLTLHSSLAGLGPLHAILSKRRGKVVTDTMVDGTDLIRITATIPQAESFVSADIICSCIFLTFHLIYFRQFTYDTTIKPFRAWHQSYLKSQVGKLQLQS